MIDSSIGDEQEGAKSGAGAGDAGGLPKLKRKHTHKISAFHQFSEREHAAAFILTKLGRGFLARLRKKKTVEQIEVRAKGRAKGLRYTSSPIQSNLYISNRIESNRI